MSQCELCGGWFGFWMCAACQNIASYLVKEQQ